MPAYVERERVALTFDPKKDRTSQQFAKDADVNVIVDRATRGAGLPAYAGIGPPRTPKYGDFSEIGDLGDVFRRYDKAVDMFYALPAKVRDLVGHDVEVFQRELENPEFLEAVSKALGEEFGPPKPDPAPEEPPAEPPAPVDPSPEPHE